MPNYDYKCEVHGIFEVQQSIKDDPLGKCPKCIQAGLTLYRCNACKFFWSLPQEMSNVQTNDSACMSCSSDDIECNPKPKKLISLSSFSLKGGGWAREGYSK